jgi:hypothetical protein
MPEKDPPIATPAPELHNGYPVGAAKGDRDVVASMNPARLAKSRRSEMIC